MLVTSGRAAMPRWAAAIAAGDVFSTTLADGRDDVRLRSKARGRSSLGPIISATRATAPLGDVLGHFQSARRGLLRCRRGTRVALDRVPAGGRHACGQIARRCSRPSRSRPARSARRFPSASSNSARSSAYCSMEMPACGSASPSGDWPKPRRSGAMTRHRSASASICAVHIVWSSGKPWTSSTGGPAPRSM